MRFLSLVLFAYLLFPASTHSQQSSGTAEDSLNAGGGLLSGTTIGGYGDAIYQRNSSEKFSSVNLERVVLFVGHRLSPDISFFSELEMEDAKVAGGEEGGEIAFEQAYLKFSLDPNHYFTAGLFLPRIGILNEMHLPTTFNGNERTQVETYIIPSTWRELGIGFYGSLASLPLEYSAAIVNGLNSAGFTHGSGIREGRFEGRDASANNLALTGAARMSENAFVVQVSGYYGGTVGLPSAEADTMHLSAGAFGTPVIIGEADLQYQANGFSAKLLGTIVSIPDAADINTAYRNNTPSREFGGYAEIGYDLLRSSGQFAGKQLIPFVRYERLNMNDAVPSNGVLDEALNQHHIITGLSYLPANNVAIKADLRFAHAGDANTTFLNLGLGYSF